MDAFPRHCESSGMLSKYYVSSLRRGSRGGERADVAAQCRAISRCTGEDVDAGKRREVSVAWGGAYDEGGAGIRTTIDTAKKQ
jgi:hypothetical protein